MWVYLLLARRSASHCAQQLVAQTLKEKLLPKFFIRRWSNILHTIKYGIADTNSIVAIRTKDIIKHQLPKKTDEVVFCPLTKKQVEVYKRILNLDDVQNMIRKDERCDCGSQSKLVVSLMLFIFLKLITDWCRRKDCCHPFKAGDLFKYMSTLIKISNHLVLILPSPKDTPEQVRDSLHFICSSKTQQWS